MYDHSVFAVLTARDEKNKASSAFKLNHNAKWFRKAIGGVEETPIIDSRQTTPAEAQSENGDSFSATDCLVLTFNELLKAPLLNGVRFGTNPSVCHVLLGHRGTRGNSAKQYDITVDDNLCIWLYDLHSKYGTAVEHEGQNHNQVRKKETWILAYQPGSEQRFATIEVFSGGLGLQIEFPNHNAADPRYIENLRAFVKECEKTGKERKEAIPDVDELGLASGKTTVAPTDAPSLRESLLYFKGEKVGKGSFGEVFKCIQLRHGTLLAAKSFTPPTRKRKRDEEIPAWLVGIRREFSLMVQNPHVGPA